MSEAIATVQVTESAPGRVTKLYRDALSLASSSMLTALFGVAFWAVCGKLISPSVLGVQTALLSIIVAPAIVVASGVGDAFTAIVPVSGPAREKVIARGYRLLIVMAGGLGIVAGTVTILFLPEVAGSVPIAVMVALGVMIWALFVVQDPALTSMRRAHWLPIENGSVSVVKVMLVPAVIALGVDKPAVVATLVPSVLAVAILYPQVKRLARLGRNEAPVPSGPNVLSELPKMVARTTTSVALSLGTLTVTPFLVTASAGPTQGAVFALCLSVVQSLDFVGAALGVSLVVHASPHGSQAGKMALAVFRRTVVVVGFGAVALVALAPVLLNLLNPAYGELHGVAVIAILAVGSFSRSVYVIWAALQRARRNMKPLLILNGVASVCVFTTVAPMARHWGAIGAAVVIAFAQIVLSGGALISLLRAHLRVRNV
jgi:O-antigen/teichoic acid export membrane protein